MPDFFEGEPADITWYPPDNPEKGKKLGNFFATSAAPPKTTSRLNQLITALQKDNPSIKNWVMLMLVTRLCTLTNANRELSGIVGEERCVTTENYGLRCVLTVLDCQSGVSERYTLQSCCYLPSCDGRSSRCRQNCHSNRGPAIKR